MDNSSNPLLCDPEKGLCEVPAKAGKNTATAVDVKKQKPVHILYFTDPICSSCWGIEPQLKKLKLEYGQDISIDYHMGGLLPSWDIYNSGGISKPSDVSHHWDEVSAYYKMPIDGDVWLEDPLPSSYPPSIAFKAAQLQDERMALAFLRRIREMVFLEKKNITKWEHLEAAAKTTGLDAARLKKDMEGAGKIAFEKDLELARQYGVRGFPTLIFTNSSNDKLTVYGFKPYEQFEQAVRSLYPDTKKQRYDVSATHLFRHYSTLTTMEYATLAAKNLEHAETELKELEKQGMIKRQNSKNGPLWIRK